ncbi:hypothetical protein KY329_05225 [Candidatus Woesearchaeota archaeon]|nr:hypothetical protein [Candidatus Woesearchaeota archaeon]
MSIRFVLVALLALAALPAFAQNIGCCCEPVLHTGYPDSETACLAKNFTYLPPSSWPTPGIMPPGQTCDDICNASLLNVSLPVCGNGICEPTEDSATCPQDCYVPSIGVCLDPAYDAPPQVSVKPVKGELALNISVSTQCPYSVAIIERCKGSACSGYVEKARGYGTHVDSDGLLWDSIYSYRVKVEYIAGGTSNAALKSAYTGDIECEGQGASAFCISRQFYDKFQPYLTQNGYGSIVPFPAAGFSAAVNMVFGSKFNSAWECDSDNVLSAAGAVCSASEVCAVGSGGPRCLSKKADCSGFNPFDLFGSIAACEGSAVPNNCFFDRSHTVADYCYSCNSISACYDYKSEGACTRDNCGVGFCDWKPSIDGTGVCIDVQKDNCANCNKDASAGSPTGAVVSVFDACTDDKAEALSTASFPCFYDRAGKKADGCDAAYCQLYAADQCTGTPVRLDGRNRIISGSSDPCNIGVCELIGVGASGYCVKNADGSTGINLADCAPGDMVCEKDYFPPQTTIYASGPANRVDYLNIRVEDRLERKGPLLDKTAEAGYTTHICVVTPNNPCNDASAFPISVSADQLIVHDLKLKKATTVLANLSLGDNTIKYYTEDPNRNLEVVKNLTFHACKNCAGPILINVSISGGDVFNDALYTSAANPTIVFHFDEPADVGFVRLMKSGTNMPIQRAGSGFSDTLTFTANSLDGKYGLSLNVFNKDSIYLDAPLEYDLYANSGVAVATSPADGEVVNGTFVDIALNFSMPVTLNNVSVLHDDFMNPYAPSYAVEDITAALSTSDHANFAYRLNPLVAGVYKLVIDAKAVNNLRIAKEVTFFTSSMPARLRLLKPSFGVTATAGFDIAVGTSLPAECRYVFGVPTAPPASQFSLLGVMSGTKVHTAQSLYMPLGSTSARLHVLCKFASGIVRQTFNISLDPERPDIVEAYALPAAVAESYYPNSSVYVTTLYVQTDKKGFCKYSKLTSDFTMMEGFFPGFNLSAKKSHSADVNVSGKGSYDYYVACAGLNELKSPSRKITFKVDPSLKFAVVRATKEGFSDTNISLGVVANKRAICYYSENNASANIPFNNGTFDFTHKQSVIVAGTGTYTFYVDCYSAASERVSLTVPVFVDTTIPSMVYVNDSSQLLENPEVSWYSNKLRVSFKGEDPESGIDHYLVSLFEKDNSSIMLLDDVAMNDSKPVFVTQRTHGGSLNLENNTYYQFSVKPVNKVRLVGDAMESDGVLVDTSKAPAQCFNFVRDGDETDVDCGGSCSACAAGLNCNNNGDCDTNFCYQRTCEITLCNDSIKNGWESDIDCGGTTCAGCALTESCIADSDCDSGYCNGNKKCDIKPACDDGKLSGGETDIDCGGPCTGCGEGQNCRKTSDCSAGLTCDVIRAVCTSTPGVESPQDPWNTYSLNDGISDGWREKYFGCIDCAQAAADFDADDDGLTNQQEYERGTNPTKSDTDNDGWSDTEEVKKGYDPLNPESHPTSILGAFFKVVVWLLIIGLLVFAGVWFWANKEKFFRPKPVPPVYHAPVKRDELAKLREFARKESVEARDWIPLKQTIEKRPLPKKDFEKELGKLRKVAKIRRDRAPLDALRDMLASLPPDAVRELRNRYKLMVDGVLSKSEIRELLAKLKVTADYYEVHQKEFEKEMQNYGK